MFSRRWYSISLKITWISKWFTIFTWENENRKVEKLVTNLHDKTQYVIHIRNVKQELNHGLILKKVHRVIKFNQNASLKPCIDMNTKLRQKAKISFEK